MKNKRHARKHERPFIAIRLWPRHHATDEAVEALIERLVEEVPAPG